MTVEELISKLQSLSQEVPGGVVMLRRGAGDWFDEIEEVGVCQINHERDGLNCDPGSDHRGDKEVIVIR